MLRLPNNFKHLYSVQQVNVVGVIIGRDIILNYDYFIKISNIDILLPQ